MFFPFSSAGAVPCRCSGRVAVPRMANLPPNLSLGGASFGGGAAPPSPAASSASGQPSKDRKIASAEQLVLDLCDAELRENALLDLSKVCLLRSSFSCKARSFDWQTNVTDWNLFGLVGKNVVFFPWKKDVFVLIWTALVRVRWMIGRLFWYSKYDRGKKLLC